MSSFAFLSSLDWEGQFRDNLDGLVRPLMVKLMKTTKPRKSRQATVAARCERRREEILEGAIKLFAQEGYAELDLQLLADDLEVGKGTLYRHFGSKQELFLAAVDRVMRKLTAQIDARCQGVEDPLEQITRGIHSYLEYFQTNPEAVELLIQERALFKDRKKPTYFVHREANIGRWRDFYRDLIAQGRIRPLPIEQMMDIIGNLLYGTMFVHYVAGRQRPPAAVAQDILEILFHGILTDAERQRRAREKSPTVEK